MYSFLDTFLHSQLKLSSSTVTIFYWMVTCCINLKVSLHKEKNCSFGHFYLFFLVFSFLQIDYTLYFLKCQILKEMIICINSCKWALQQGVIHCILSDSTSQSLDTIQSWLGVSVPYWLQQRRNLLNIWSGLLQRIHEKNWI